MLGVSRFSSVSFYVVSFGENFKFWAQYSQNGTSMTKFFMSLKVMFILVESTVHSFSSRFWGQPS